MEIPATADRWQWQHQWRSCLRNMLFRLGTHRADARGSRGAVNWDCSSNLLKALPPGRNTTLVLMLLTGGIKTKEGLCRWNSVTVEQALCKYCNGIDTLARRLWRCRRWRHFRPPCIPDVEELPQCTALKGLVPLRQGSEWIHPWIGTL